jgi:hypothetical protein
MRTARTLEELRHVVGDVVEVASFSDAQMVQALLKRVNGGATMKLLLRAALSVARERETDRIAELERQRDDAVLDCDELEEDLQELRRKLDALIAAHTHGGQP